MKDGKTIWVCNECGESQAKWAGKCGSCNAWGSLVETRAAMPIKAGKGLGNRMPARAGTVARIGTIKAGDFPRMASGLSELDRVFGGGVVPGSATLMSGDPGIGKSTLLLQALGIYASKGVRPLYVSAEESDHQIKGRADRIGCGDAPMDLTAEKDVQVILGYILSGNYDLVVVDSIQTVYMPELDGIPGSISQVKTCASQLCAAAKQANVALVMVGHVTKDGSVAGPKTVEHLVDTLLVFDDQHHQNYRILRATKNRFGSTDEIGVFEMTGTGLQEVINPSGIFIADRQAGLPGSVVFPAMEGTRPILLEIQALAIKSALGNARRVSIGFDSTRLAMILAVIEARAGVSVGAHDIFLNVAGGYKITEPAADLAVACAVLSALAGEAFDDKAAVVGEIGLGGEIRPVPSIEQRAKEASKLGFPSIIAPYSGTDKLERRGNVRLRKLTDALGLVPMIKRQVAA